LRTAGFAPHSVHNYWGPLHLVLTHAVRQGLIAQLASELRKLRLASLFSSDGDLVFCSTTGKTMGHRNLTARALEKAAKRAGLRDVTFHVLRRTFASRLIAKGHDPVLVCRRLGHANAAITLKVYAHLFDAERHAVEARSGLEADYGTLLG
jgi:integrase